MLPSHLPVSASDVEQLQSGIQFFTDQAQATVEAAAINAPGATETLFTYAATLLQNNLSLSQVAMADTAIMEGGAIAVGDASTVNTVAFLTLSSLPAQVAVAMAHGPTVYASEALGLALANTAGFNGHFAGLNETAFVQAAATATGVNTSAITQFVDNWTAFYSGAGSAAHSGLTVQQAAYGAAFGDAIGIALLNQTSAFLNTDIFTNQAFPHSPNTVYGHVANALIDNAEGLYKIGATLPDQNQHTVMQGEVSGGVGPIGLIGVVPDHPV